MESLKLIEKLQAENEFLQTEMEELLEALKKKEIATVPTIEPSESYAFMQSKIDSNLLEIQQLRYNYKIEQEKLANAQLQNEELELTLLQEIKERVRDKENIKVLTSIETNAQIISQELDEANNLYGDILRLTDQLAELKSENELLQIENENLKYELLELKELNELLKIKSIERN